jgi:hypothetical protein
MNRIALDLIRVAKEIVAGRDVERILFDNMISQDELGKVYKKLPASAKGYRDIKRRSLQDMLSSWQAPYIWVVKEYVRIEGSAYQDYGDVLVGGGSSSAEGRKAITGEEFLAMLK